MPERVASSRIGRRGAPPRRSGAGGNARRHRAARWARVERLERRSLLSPLSDAAYELLHERIGAIQGAAYVYKDGDAGGNIGFASGYFGSDLDRLHIQTDAVHDPQSPNGVATDPGRLDRARGTVLQFRVDPLAARDFVGLNFEEPLNWGQSRTGVGYDLRETPRGPLESPGPSRARRP